MKSLNAGRAQPAFGRVYDAFKRQIVSGLGDHATKLIGWGFDDETKDPYWLMMNSWANWGEDGVGKVGVGEMNLEGEAVGVQM